MKKIFLLALLWGYGTTISALSNNTVAELQNYITTVMQNAFGLLDDQTLSEEEKISKARLSLKQNLDLDIMAEYALGKYYTQLNDNQRKEYINAYSNNILNIYSGRVNKYNGQKISIRKIDDIGKDEYKVRTTILKNSTPYISIDFYVTRTMQNKHNIYQVYDIVTEGISLLQTQKAEYESYISERGVDRLIEKLKSM